jgi:cytochrome c55X
MRKLALKPTMLLIAAVLAVTAFTPPTELSVKRQGELLYILEQDCGSCHGLTMKGGLGPALTLEAMRDRTLDDLTHMILDGVPGTPMPPWRPLLSEQEALFMAQVIKSGDKVK